MGVGTEHEYSINDSNFRPLPVSDLIIERISGKIQNEALLGNIIVSKELQKHVLEIVPHQPSEQLATLEKEIHSGITTLYHLFTNEYKLLGLGMHPLLTLDMTEVWNHDEGEIYKHYDRIFTIRQHGWLNIQALQINVPYSDENHLVSLYNKIRLLLPYIIAVSAASPFVEGKLTGTMDNRLIYYRQNQRNIPLICNDLIPEKITRLDDYTTIQNEIFEQLKRQDAEILCKEWVNSRGVIVRFSRQCLEIKAIDEQECVHSDMAMTAFVLALLRCKDLNVDDDHDALLSMTEDAIISGTQKLRPELEKLFSQALVNATIDEKRYLPLVKKRIEKGSLAEVLTRRYTYRKSMSSLLQHLEYCLRENIPYS